MLPSCVIFFSSCNIPIYYLHASQGFLFKATGSQL